MTTRSLVQLIGLVFVAVTLVVFGDTAGKLLGQAGVNPFVIAWSRFALAAIFLLPFSGITKKELGYLKDWRIVMRSVFIVCGICSILTALKTEPIANVFGAFFVGPIVSYILAIVFLRERPSVIRGLLLGLGFFGVMLVVKPGFGATRGIGFAVLAGVFYGSYLVSTKLVAGQFRPRFLLMSQLLIGTVILTPIGLSMPLPSMNTEIALLIAISAAGSALGNYLLVIANRMAEASLIAPLVYSQLISATILGIVIFGDWPDSYALVGLVIIVVSGGGVLLVTKMQMKK